jgi:hypothetical protein
MFISMHNHNLSFYTKKMYLLPKLSVFTAKAAPLSYNFQKHTAEVMSQEETVRSWGFPPGGTNCRQL